MGWVTLLAEQLQGPARMWAAAGRAGKTTFGELFEMMLSKLEWPFKRVALAWDHIAGAASPYDWPATDIFVLFLAVVAVLIFLGLILKDFSGSNPT